MRFSRSTGGGGSGMSIAAARAMASAASPRAARSSLVSLKCAPLAQWPFCWWLSLLLYMVFQWLGWDWSGDGAAFAEERFAAEDKHEAGNEPAVTRWHHFRAMPGRRRVGQNRIVVIIHEFSVVVWECAWRDFVRC